MTDDRPKKNADKPLTRAQTVVLRRAMRRPDGCVCPTPGLRGGAQTAVLDSLERRGLIARDPRPPHAPKDGFFCALLRITEAGVDAAILPGEERPPARGRADA